MGVDRTGETDVDHVWLFTALSPSETDLILYARVDNIPSSNTDTSEASCNALG